MDERRYISLIVDYDFSFFFDFALAQFGTTLCTTIGSKCKGLVRVMSLFLELRAKREF